jgi:hypothetical protein
MDRQTFGKMDEWMDGWADNRKDRWTNFKADWQMNRQTMIVKLTMRR